MPAAGHSVRLDLQLLLLLLLAAACRIRSRRRRRRLLLLLLLGAIGMVPLHHHQVIIVVAAGRYHLLLPPLLPGPLLLALLLRALRLPIASHLLPLLLPPRRPCWLCRVGTVGRQLLLLLVGGGATRCRPPHILLGLAEESQLGRRGQPHAVRKLGGRQLQERRAGAGWRGV